MKKAILATKVGMTQIFDENGVLVPVTVLQAGPCVVTQVKTADNDGYSAIQVGFGEKKENRVNKPMKGQFAKAGVSCKRYLKEFRFEDAETYTLGQEIKADIFGAGDKIDATATSRMLIFSRFSPLTRPSKTIFPPLWMPGRAEHKISCRAR